MALLQNTWDNIGTFGNSSGQENIQDQKEIKNLENPIIDGKIKRHDIIKRNGDDLHKIEIDSSVKEFTIFGDLNVNVGDYLKFEYVQKGPYFNIKEIIEWKKLGTAPIKNELNLVRDRINYKDNKPLCIEMAFRFGIVKDYSIEEIFALYYRLLNELDGESDENTIV